MHNPKEIDCTCALGIPFKYDRIRELGVPYLNQRWRAYCSRKFNKVLVEMGDRLKDSGILHVDSIKAILTGGCYVDKPGQHGKGNACDFDGFLTGDDEVVLYKAGVNLEVEGYRIRSMSRKLASRIACAISLHAGVVLTEHYNSLHEDHIHFDISRGEKWLNGGSRSQNLVVQAALKYWHDNTVQIDGIVGKQTRKAMKEFLGDSSAGTWNITDTRWKAFLEKVAAG